MLTNRPGLKDTWSTLSADQKAAFYKEQHAAIGNELAMAIQVTVDKVYVRKNTTSFQGDSDWLDEIDLRDRLKDKPPEYLQNALQNSRTMIHPTLRCTLYELTAFKGTSAESTQEEDKRIVHMSGEKTMKAEKKAITLDGPPKMKRLKAEPKEKPQPPLTGKGLEKVQAMAASMRKAMSEDTTPLKLHQYPDVPKIFGTVRAKKLAEVQVALAELDMAITSGLGKAPPLLAMAKQALSEYYEILEKIDANISELEALGVEPVA